MPITNPPLLPPPKKKIKINIKNQSYQRIIDVVKASSMVFGAEPVMNDDEIFDKNQKP